MQDLNFYEDLALSFAFGNKRKLEDVLKLIEEKGLTFRKNKGIKDINNAMRKAFSFKNGGKLENELGMFELYLRDILKKK